VYRVVVVSAMERSVLVAAFQLEILRKRFHEEKGHPSQGRFGGEWSRSLKDGWESRIQRSHTYHMRSLLVQKKGHTETLISHG
jgi:hypothetical protein